jgi:hypothetical protein
MHFVLLYFSALAVLNFLISLANSAVVVCIAEAGLCQWKKRCRNQGLVERSVRSPTSGRGVSSGDPVFAGVTGIREGWRLPLAGSGYGQFGHCECV